MATILEQLNDLIVHLENWGYIVVFIIVLLECQAFLGLFMPGESMVVLCGFLAGQGVLDVRVLIGVVAVAAIIGDSVGYELGRWLGRDWLRRHGGKFWLRPERLDRMDAFFARYGGLGVFFAHFLHVGRALMPFLAGASRLPYLRFLFFNAIGCALWAAIFSLLGYLFGQSWELIHRWIGRAGIIASILVAMCLLAFWLWRGITSRELEIREWWRQFCARPGVVRLRRRFARQIDWLEQRFSPRGYLGIHLTVGIFLLLGAAAIFSGPWQDFSRRAGFAAFDAQVAAWFANRAGGPVSQVMQHVGRLGSALWLGALFLGAIVIWRRGRNRLRLLLLAGPGGVLLDLLLKFLLAREGLRFASVRRGAFYGPLDGDLMAATVVYGALAYVLVRSVDRWRWRVLIPVASLLFILLVALGSLYWGATQFSAMLVAIVEGAVWLLFCISGVEIVRWREAAHPVPREMARLESESR